jgi:hypothetical protein
MVVLYPNDTLSEHLSSPRYRLLCFIHHLQENSVPVNCVRTLDISIASLYQTNTWFLNNTNNDTHGAWYTTVFSRSLHIQGSRLNRKCSKLNSKNARFFSGLLRKFLSSGSEWFAPSHPFRIGSWSNKPHSSYSYRRCIFPIVTARGSGIRLTEVSKIRDLGHLTLGTLHSPQRCRAYFRTKISFLRYRGASS